ncbi:hypothetical protein HY449_04565 [Candidatus Pacearchaeota archaeon]|nr:hypothetical protein [Candidatus Pacearchaeota archaeon]
MKIPRIEFIWSWIYQQEVHSANVKTETYDFEIYDRYVSNFIKEIKLEWNKNGNKILSYMEEITNLKWKEEKINCYVIKISTFPPFSIPLTIPIQFETPDKKTYTLSTERYLDMLIHELIHNLFVQNEKETDKYFEHVFDKYRDEPFNTVLHILLHTIHKKIFLKFFGIKRLNDEIEKSSYYPDYKRSWEIVNKKGEDSIIKEFRDYLDVKPKEKA